MAVGVLVGMVGIMTVSASSQYIKNATLRNSSSKVYFYGKEVKLEQPLLAVKLEGNQEEKLYMPLREILEYMNFNVEWNSQDSSVNLTMKQQMGKSTNMNNTTNENGQYTGGVACPIDLTKGSLEENLIQMMQMTGNWRYVEPYLDKVDEETLREIVKIYNSKHANPAEHKVVEDYLQKIDKP